MEATELEGKLKEEDRKTKTATSRDNEQRRLQLPIIRQKLVTHSATMSGTNTRLA